jgi:hypothetical protein
VQCAGLSGGQFEKKDDSTRKIKGRDRPESQPRPISGITCFDNVALKKHLARQSFGKLQRHSLKIANEFLRLHLE